MELVALDIIQPNKLGNALGDKIRKVLPQLLTD